MSKRTQEIPDPLVGATDEALPEIEIADEDILDAMRHIPGYLDISTADFAAIYHLAHHHAVDRLFGALRAEKLMRTDFRPLAPDMRLADAVRSLVAQGFKGLPVAGDDGRLCGMFTETDVLRRLAVGSFLGFIQRSLDGEGGVDAQFKDTLVADVMTRAPVAVGRRAGFRDIVAAFHRHPGRSMPVIEDNAAVCGLIVHRQFIAACHLEKMP